LTGLTDGATGFICFGVGKIRGLDSLLERAPKERVET